jgi:6,7-dimethyl-8-ribityllumazine synthase
MDQMQTVEGDMVVRDERFCIVAARFNEAIVENLIAGALDALKRHGANETHIGVIRVPGAYELPLAVQRVAKTRQYDGIVALGAVIRGATPHFDIVCSECASGLSRVSLDLEIPVGFGLLTCDSVEQAIERSGGKSGNKGFDAALAAIEMVNLLRQIDS